MNPDEMTPEQVNRAVAELCGWLNVHNNPDLARKVHTNPRTTWVGISPAVQTLARGKDTELDCNYWPIEPYATSLDAMAQAEATLTAEECFSYRDLLFEAVNPKREAITGSSMCVFGATAAQRARAFLRVKSKGKN